MSTALPATKTPLSKVLFRKDQQARIVDIIVLSFDELGIFSFFVHGYRINTKNAEFDIITRVKK
jgi:hypothetical protein